MANTRATADTDPCDPQLLVVNWKANMDIQASNSHLPALYQGSVILFRESMLYSPSLYHEDNVDYVEIREGRLSTAHPMVKNYASVAALVIERGTLIDLFA
jgi:hypothetical protein